MWCEKMSSQTQPQDRIQRAVKFFNFPKEQYSRISPDHLKTGLYQERLLYRRRLGVPKDFFFNPIYSWLKRPKHFATIFKHVTYKDDNLYSTIFYQMYFFCSSFSCWEAITTKTLKHSRKEFEYKNPSSDRKF